MRRNAYRPAPVAADSSRRAACRDRCSLSAAGTARRSFEIPGAVRSSVKGAMRLPRHEEFRNRGVAENDGARLFQPGNQRRVRGGDIALPDSRSCFALQSGNIDRTFDRYRNTVQRTQRPLRTDGFISSLRRDARPFFINTDKRVQPGIPSFDLSQMSLEQLGCGDLSVPNARSHLPCG